MNELRSMSPRALDPIFRMDFAPWVVFRGPWDPRKKGPQRAFNLERQRRRSRRVEAARACRRALPWNPRFRAGLTMKLRLRPRQAQAETTLKLS